VTRPLAESSIFWDIIKQI